MSFEQVSARTVCVPDTRKHNRCGRTTLSLAGWRVARRRGELQPICSAALCKRLMYTVSLLAPVAFGLRPWIVRTPQIAPE